MLHITSLIRFSVHPMSRKIRWWSASVDAISSACTSLPNKIFLWAVGQHKVCLNHSIDLLDRQPSTRPVRNSSFLRHSSFTTLVSFVQPGEHQWCFAWGWLGAIDQHVRRPWLVGMVGAGIMQYVRSVEDDIPG